MLYGVTVVDDLGVSCVSEWGLVDTGPRGQVVSDGDHTCMQSRVVGVVRSVG